MRIMEYRITDLQNNGLKGLQTYRTAKLQTCKFTELQKEEGRRKKMDVGIKVKESRTQKKNMKK